MSSMFFCSRTLPDGFPGLIFLFTLKFGYAGGQSRICGKAMMDMWKLKRRQQGSFTMEALLHAIDSAGSRSEVVPTNLILDCYYKQ
jgi:hypothetical protein